MKNLVIDDFIYYRIFIHPSEKLIKYSSVEIEAWKLLQSKNLSFINTPTTVFTLDKEEKEIYPYCNSKIYLPILTDFDTLVDSQNTKSLDTKSILFLYKKCILLLKEMHNSGIIHSDINATNIMINKEFNIKFIDFDASIIDNFISRENIYVDDGLSTKSIINNSIVDDKVELLFTFLLCLENGHFIFSEDRFIDFSILKLNNSMVNELKSYLLGKVKPVNNYYFEDIIDDLLKMGYEAPKCKRY